MKVNKGHSYWLPMLCHVKFVYFIKYAHIKFIHKCMNNQVPQWPVGSSQGIYLHGEPQGVLMWNFLPTEPKVDHDLGSL